MTTSTEIYLPGSHERARWDVRDTALILRRFHYCERALILAQSAWLPAIASYEIKTGTPMFIWQQTLNADALRTRVYELRFPSRLMEVGGDRQLEALFASTIDAPSAGALFHALATVHLPALLSSFREFLALSDIIGDGPTHRFLTLSVQEKEKQIAQYTAWAEALFTTDQASRQPAEAWSHDQEAYLQRLGGVGLEENKEPLPDDFHSNHSTPWRLAEVPARDQSFRQVRFYWPDIVDETFPYGDGIRLQLRSAISHFNEIWAVETAGALLHGLADELPWEFIVDAARWGYDESRHCRMGLERLTQWGLRHDELPLGTYIYDSARGQDLIYRLGMLYFFETKNIGKKHQRVKAFQDYRDAVSEHDMDFDWADETIHSHYGNRWLTELLKVRGLEGNAPDEIRKQCSKLVDEVVATKSEVEVSEIREIAEQIIGAALERSSEAAG